MSENSKEELSVQGVFNEISKYLENGQLYERLLNVLHEDADYKCLLKTSEKQFFDGPSASHINEKYKTSRSCCEELNDMVVQVDEGIDKIVREKFKGKFLDKLKDEVLQAILLLSSKQLNSSDSKCQASTPIVKSRRNAKKTVLSKTKISTKNCTQNGNNIKEEEENVINKYAQSTVNLEELKDEGDIDVGSLFSFDSVSSVHTSDLSSFEDEISLSSVEEFGPKRRLSLKEVQEKLEKSKYEEIDIGDDYELVKSIQVKDEQSDFPVNNNSSSQKSQRKRKPNLKYTDDDDDDIFLSAKERKTLTSSRSVCGDTPRKRGRPRKHST